VAALVPADTFAVDDVRLGGGPSIFVCRASRGPRGGASPATITTYLCGSCRMAVLWNRFGVRGPTLAVVDDGEGERKS